MDIQNKSIETAPSLIAKVVEGAGVNFLGTVFRAVLGFVFIVLLSHVLTVSDLGLYTLGSIVVLLFSFISLLGLDMGLWKYVSAFNTKDDRAAISGTILASLLVAMPASVIITIILLIWADPISSTFIGNADFATTLRAFSITVPMLVAARLLNAATQGLHYMQYTAIRNTAEQGFRLLFTALVFIAGFRLGGALVANAVAVAVITIMSFYFLERVCPIMARKSNTIARIAHIRPLVKFSIPLGVASVAVFLLMWIDTMFLGYFRTSADVGLYSVAMRVIVIMAIMQNSFSTMFAPVISDLFTRGRHIQLEELFKRVTRWIFALSVPMFLPLILFPGQVLELFGDQFTVVSASLVVLSLGQLVNVATGPVGAMITMTGRPGLEMANTLVTLLIGIILCIILIPRLGILGAAIANAVVAAVANIVRSLEVKIILKMHAYNLEYFKPLIAGGIAGLGSFLGINLLPVGSRLTSLALWFGVLLVVYIAVVGLFGLDEEDSEVARSLRLRLSRAKAL